MHVVSVIYHLLVNNVNVCMHVLNVRNHLLVNVAERPYVCKYDVFIGISFVIVLNWKTNFVNSFLKIIFDWFGMNEKFDVCKLYDIKVNDSPNSYKRKNLVTF